jgi:hypothetical protein
MSKKKTKIKETETDGVVVNVHLSGELNKQLERLMFHEKNNLGIRKSKEQKLIESLQICLLKDLKGVKL